MEVKWEVMDSRNESDTTVARDEKGRGGCARESTSIAMMRNSSTS